MLLGAGSVLAAGALGGCGFEPLYAKGPVGPDRDLPAIYVANIPEGRSGQLLRQGLQTRLGSPVSGAASRYILSAFFYESSAGIGVQPDNSATYTRIIGDASWTLTTVGIFPTTLATGAAHTLDGYNNVDLQFFEAQIEGETAANRVIANLADEITLQVATWFKRHDAAAIAALVAAGEKRTASHVDGSGRSGTGAAATVPGTTGAGTTGAGATGAVGTGAGTAGPGRATRF